MHIIDIKFKDNLFHYFIQTFIAVLTILAILLFLDVLTETAIITSLGASTFIVFTMPTTYSSDPRRLIGGYSIGIVIGILFFYITTIHEMQIMITPYLSPLVIFGAIAVGIAIFLMTLTNAEHAPAAGIALGLVINQWDGLTILFIIIAILWLAGIRKVFRPYLMDLCSPTTK